MGLRAKVFLIVGSAVSILFFLVSLYIYLRLEHQFIGAQRDDADTQIRIVEGIIDHDTQSFEQKAIDWSHWDDTYDFVQTKDPEYIESNLNDESFRSLGVDFMLFLDAQGNTVFGKQVLPEKEGEAIPEALQGFLSQDPRFQGLSEKREIFSGVVPYDGQFVFLTVQPILVSTGTGDSDGALFFGRFLTQDYLDDIGSLAHIGVALDRYDDHEVSPEFAQARQMLTGDESNFIEIDQSTRRVVVSHLLHDSFDRPGPIIQIRYDGNILKRGAESLTLFRNAGVILCLAFVLLIFFLSDRIVLRKILHLQSEVKRVASEKSAGNHISIVGNDEFASLGRGINTMLDTLQTMIERTARSENRFEVVANLAPVMIWMTDEDNHYTYLNKNAQDFGDPTGKETDWDKNVFVEDRGMRKALIDEAKEKQRPFRLEYRLQRKDGKELWVSESAVPYITSSGKLSGYIGVVTDIHKTKEVQIETKAFTKEVEEMNEMLMAREEKMLRMKEEIAKLRAQLG